MNRLLKMHRRNTELLVKNIILQCDIETLVEFPDSPEAEKLREKYLRNIRRKRENEQATQN